MVAGAAFADKRASGVGMHGCSGRLGGGVPLPAVKPATSHQPRSDASTTAPSTRCTAPDGVARGVLR